jgi:hypothetical protein
MKLLSLQLTISILLPLVAAKNGDDCCKFSLTSPGCFPGPAGQLEDGQIRFNGSYPESTFCLNKNGGITDQNGFGCIVTGEYGSNARRILPRIDLSVRGAHNSDSM